MYKRHIQEKIEEWLFRNKILILYGARQVGKTTLAKQLLAKYSNKKSAYFNCEDPVVQAALIDKSAEQISNFLGDVEIVVLDEAQTVPNIGRVLKLFSDQYPHVQVIATGSSSFDLASQINEPLTGRSLEFTLFPLSIAELSKTQNQLYLQSNLTNYLLYGLYPEIVDKDNQTSQTLVLDLAKKYVFKDILNFEGIRNSVLIMKILQALAYQLGSELSLTELADLVGSNRNTVERYIQILEKSFIIFSLPAYSTNLRNEISKSRKIYFYDVGIRNALIEDFGPIELRRDRGAIWENFVIVELLKKYKNKGELASFYFWRTYTQKEIDLLIKQNNYIHALEMKWSPKKIAKLPRGFKEIYPESDFAYIHSGNWLTFLGPSK